MRLIKEHSLQKLEYLRKYIKGYLTATKRLQTKYYIDAFAGTGKCLLHNTKQQVDGSSLIALRAEGIFSKYILIEKNENNFKILKECLKNEIPEDRLNLIEFYNGDCNVFLKEYKFNPSPYVGYFVLLDPAGPELEWETINVLSKLKKIDLLILYPYDMSLVRLVTKYPWKLDKFYGSKEWLDIYKKRTSATNARNNLLKFYIHNLEQLGFESEFIDCRPIRRKFREGKLLYYLIFATHNSVAKKIISYIFNKELDGQETLKLN
jgi:three-Cys-motif partner protein